MTLNEKDQARLTGYSSEVRSKKTYTNEELEQALRDAAKSEGILSRKVYEAHYEQSQKGVPHPYTIIRRYGKWNTALQKAGLATRKRAPYKTRITPESCVSALLYVRRELGDLPSVGEYEEMWHNGSRMKDQNYPAASTIRLKFKTWRKACAEAAKSID